MKKTLAIFAVLIIVFAATSAIAADWTVPKRVDLASVAHSVPPDGSEASWILARIASTNGGRARVSSTTTPPLPAIPMTTDPAILVTHLKADWLATADSDAGFTSTIITVANISAQSMLVKKYVNRFGDEVTMDILSFDSGLAPNSAIDFWDSSAQGARATGVRQLVLYVFNPQAGTLSRITSDIGQNASFLQVDGVIAGYDQFGLYLQLHGNFNPSVPALVSIGGMLPGSDTKVGGDTITVRPPNGAIYGPAMYDITVQQNGSAYTYPWKFVPWGKG